MGPTEREVYHTNGRESAQQQIEAAHQLEEDEPEASDTRSPRMPLRLGSQRWPVADQHAWDALEPYLGYGICNRSRALREDRLADLRGDAYNIDGPRLEKSDEFSVRKSCVELHCGLCVTRDFRIYERCLEVAKALFRQFKNSRGEYFS